MRALLVALRMQLRNGEVVGAPLHPGWLFLGKKARQAREATFSAYGMINELHVDMNSKICYRIRWLLLHLIQRTETFPGSVWQMKIDSRSLEDLLKLIQTLLEPRRTQESFMKLI